MAEVALWMHTAEHAPAPVPHGCWLKRFLSRLRVESRLGTERENEDTCHWSRNRIIVVLLVLVALVLMGLLLLLNYNCIVVWHLCYDEVEYGALSFGDG